MDDGTVLRARIVETEAYDQDDAASHSFGGRRERARVMFGQAGHAYVYVSYGIHHCFNVVTGPEGHGAGVLIRGVEPIEGLATMQRLRGRTEAALTNGPGKVCQALAIGMALYGHDLSEAPLRLLLRPALPDTAVGVSGRIGISKATDKPWRFYVPGSSGVTKGAASTAAKRTAHRG